MGGCASQPLGSVASEVFSCFLTGEKSLREKTTSENVFKTRIFFFLGGMQSLCRSDSVLRLFPPPPWPGWEGAEAGAGLWPPGVACGQTGPSTGSAPGEGTPGPGRGNFLSWQHPKTPPEGLRATSASPQPAQGGDILCEGDDGGHFVTSQFLFLFCPGEGLL